MKSSKSADDLYQEFKRQFPDKTMAHAKLSVDQIRTIRRVYKMAEAEKREHGMQTFLAKQFGVSNGTIRSIVMGNSWEWVDE